MKRFCVSFIDFFDNDLTSKMVEGENELDAALSYLEKYQGPKLCSEDFQDLENLKENCFDNDCMINAIEIIN